jgi:hypothetical protein
MKKMHTSSLEAWALAAAAAAAAAAAPLLSIREEGKWWDLIQIRRFL